jgi:flagellar export protein FliJ
MKRFVWRLQRVLEIKTRQEQIKKSELIAISERLVQARRSFLAEQAKLRQMIKDIHNKQPRERLTAQQLFMSHSAQIDERIKGLEQKVHQFELEKNQKTTELLKLKRFREALEKLRQRAKAEYITSMERLEQKQADERTTGSFARRQMLASE